MSSTEYEIKTFPNSVRFYLPRTEGYMEVLKEIAAEYGSMSLFEFDGYFEGKFEPVKYMRVEVHTTDVDVDEQKIVEYANEVRSKLQQRSLAFEYNNKLILVSSSQ
jgi:hypothetical protein